MVSAPLSEFLRVRATELAVPGAAAGVVVDGRASYTYHGVTNIEHPLPVDESTLFHVGSITKTYVATALMTLVHRGEVDLDAPVRRYVPELTLADESVATAVTVRHLLNHSAGLSDFEDWDTGEGDDALARLVARLPELGQATPLGRRAAYNNAAFSLAGRVLEMVTGSTFEAAVRSLVLEPAGLRHSFLLPQDLMTRRYSAGHNVHADGTVTLAVPWKSPRAANPPGGLTATVGDLLGWGQFHLGTGTGVDGRSVLSGELLASMQRPTIELRGTGIGDAVGIAWLLRDIGGVPTVGHGGGMSSQYSHLLLVPDHRFAVAVVANCSPQGMELIQDVYRWALESFLGLVDRDPEPIELDAAAAATLAGTYERDTMRVTITAADRTVSFDFAVRPDGTAGLGENVPTFPTSRLGVLPGDGDEYILLDGPFKGMRGMFSRAADGNVSGLDFNNRPYARTSAPVMAL